MRAGEFADGARTLRAKIDMASGNINLRDPALYRIRTSSTRTPATPGRSTRCTTTRTALRDALEGITHSLCTLEFEDHRPLYDWCVDNVDLAGHPELLAAAGATRGFAVPAGKPRQIEFSRLNINYTVMSKRKLLALVQDGLVDGWDDPRMPTLQGLRRRGYPPAALRLLADRVGISKQNSLIDFSVLEGCVREDTRCARAAPHGRGRSAQAGHHQPARRPRRIAALLQPSEERRLRQTRRAVLARAVDRARGLHGSAAPRASTA